MDARHCPRCGKVLSGKRRRGGMCPTCRIDKSPRFASSALSTRQPELPSPLARWGRREWLLSAVLVVLPLIAFSPVLHAGFLNFDDPEYVANNAQVQEGLSRQGITWAWTTTAAANWHPLTWLSLMLDTQVFGTQPWGYHLTSLLLHLASTLVLFALLRRTTGEVLASALVAALFAVHPLHVESVAWISERKDVLSTLWGLLAILAYARYAEAPGLGRYLAVLGCLTLSLLAKPMFVTLPFLLLLLDYWPLRRWPFPGTLAPGQRSLRRLVWEKVPLLVLVVFSCLITLWAQQQGQAVSSLKQTSLSERLSNSLLSYAHYLRQTILPTDLAAFYPHPHGRGSAGLSVLAGLLLVGLTALAWRLRKERPYLLVGWLWYLGTLVPVIGLIQVGGQARADRYTYFPLVGVFLASVWGLTELSRRWNRERLGGWLALGVLLVLTGASRLQASVWHDSVTLWRHTIEVTDNSWMAYKLLNEAWAEQGRARGAEPFFRAIVQARPEDAGAHNALGQVLLESGKVEEAQQEIQEALRLEPDHSLAHYNLGQLLLRQHRAAEAARHFEAFLEEDPHSGQGHNLLGLAQMEMGQQEEARAHFEKALQLAPESARLSAQAPDAAPVLYNLGSAWQAEGKWSQAAACFEQCVVRQPRSSKYHRALAFAFSQEGRKREAQEHYRASVLLDPSWPQASAQRAWLLAAHPDPRQRNGSRALDHALQASQAVGDGDPRIADALAAAQAEVGRFEEAARTAQQAAAQAEKLGQHQLAGQIRERALLYSHKKCYRLSP